MDFFSETFLALQGLIFDRIVQPLLFWLGMGSLVELGFDAVEIFLWGVIQLALAYCLVRPLEKFFPVESGPRSKGVGVDVLYTLINRLGLVPLAVFGLLAPLMMRVDGWLRLHDLIPRQLEDWLPGLDGRPLLIYFVYLVVLDFAEYWRHRLSHRFGWWWALHSIHHSQRHLTLWSDNRNHLLDDVISGVWFSLIGLAIGASPGHFIGPLLVFKLLESLSHANARIWFGAVGEQLLVSPRYHRLHHALDLPEGERYRYGCNFSIVFPVWDLLFGTRYQTNCFMPTGLHHVAEDSPEHNRFWAQQWQGLREMVRALAGHEPSR